MSTVTINQEQIVYEDVGCGMPILFIHPGGMGRKIFYKQFPLSSKYRLILPDLVGQGESSYNGKTNITMQRFVEDLLSLLDYLKLDSVVLFGYSSGGSIAQHLAIHYPSRVNALILSGGFPVVENMLLKDEHLLGIYAVRKMKSLVSRVLAFAHTPDKEYRKILRDHMNQSDKEVWSKSYLESLRYDCRDELKSLEIPVLLLYGGMSDITNTYIKFYEKHLPNKQIHVIKGGRHELPTLNSEQVNQLVWEFLQ